MRHSSSKETQLDLPAFVADLLNQVARGRNRIWLQTRETLGHRMVWEVAVCTGFFTAGDPEGVVSVKQINAHSNEIYALLNQAEAGKLITPDDLEFLEQ